MKKTQEMWTKNDEATAWHTGNKKRPFTELTRQTKEYFDNVKLTQRTTRFVFLIATQILILALIITT